MKIKSFKVYQAELPQVEGNYSWGKGDKVDVLKSTVLAMQTEKGIIGYGEVVPLGKTHVPTLTANLITSLKQLMPHLIGKDATQISVILGIVDYVLLDQPYVRTLVEMACWDALGKLTSQPLSTLLGGKMRDSVVLYKSIPQRSPKENAELLLKYKKQGYTRFQIKIGTNVEEDVARIKACSEVLDEKDMLWADANTALTSHEAICLANSVKDIKVILEQPCWNREECKRVRQHTNLPFLMDEGVFDIQSVLDVWNDGIADIMSIKIAKFGGITKMKQALNLCVALGIQMVIDDNWGGDFNTSAIIQLASTVPENLHFASSDLNNYNTVHTGHTIGGELIKGGRIRVPTAPGLGVEPNWNVLGEPILTYDGKNNNK